VPRSRNTRVRPKNTSRADARRRHKEEHRATDVEPNTLSDQADANAQASTAAARPAFGLPNVREDIVALPQVFRKPLVWLPFGLLLLSFVLALALVAGAIPEGPVQEIAGIYVSFTLLPTTLFIFFIGGFVAEKASYMVGFLLGVFDAILVTIFYGVAPSLAEDADPNAVLGGVEGEATTVSIEFLGQMWAMALLIGTFSAGFAAWYRRFLRSSQERARLNRMAKEQEQARQAKEQARADKQAARDARRAR
jgi:hypothetical protein